MALFSYTRTVSRLSKSGLISLCEWIIPAVETCTTSITAVICSIHSLNHEYHYKCVYRECNVAIPITPM